MQGYFGGYTLVALLGLVGIGFIATGFAANRLLRPWRHTEAKLLTYESGVDPVGEDWAQSQVRYYVYAFLYVVFAVDAVFLFPWATVFAAPAGTEWVDLYQLHVGTCPPLRRRRSPARWTSWSPRA